MTAASESYAPSLLALLGSLTLNWPEHPPVLVYDIGLGPGSLAALGEHGIDVKRVPPFCPHWRKHFTWKLWCWQDAPAPEFLWLDAGLVVLSPLDEVFDATGHIGYFAVPTYHLLSENASEAACRGCGVPPSFREGKMTVAGGVVGFRRQGAIEALLHEALSISLTEAHIAATSPRHRHDQALLSLVMYKHFGHVLLMDGTVYAGWESPRQVPGQKVWVHRRRLSPEDLELYASCISAPGKPHAPSPPRALWLQALLAVPARARKLGRSQRDAGHYDGIR